MSRNAKKPTTKAAYRLWLRMEEVTLNPKNEVIDRKDLDDKFPPVQVGEFTDKELAAQTMTAISKQYNNRL